MMFAVTTTHTSSLPHAFVAVHQPAPYEKWLAAQPPLAVAANTGRPAYTGRHRSPAAEDPAREPVQGAHRLAA